MIVRDLTSENCCYKIRGILGCLEKKTLSSNEASALRGLLSDEQLIDIRRVCDFAAAACDVLGIEKYAGTEECVLEMIADLGKG